MVKPIGCYILDTTGKPKKPPAVFLPFETGASEKNAQDKASDGELYLKQEKHTIGGLSAINPYSCQQSFPLAFASQSEGFKISLEKLEEKYLQAKTQ